MTYDMLPSMAFSKRDERSLGEGWGGGGGLASRSLMGF